MYKSKLCGYKIGTQFKKSVQNTTNYATKILNVYIAYDLDNWPRSPLYNFALKYCLFGATVIVRNSDKSKYLYIDYRIAFNGAGSWSFDNQFVRNALIFGADNISSSHGNKNFIFFKILRKIVQCYANGQLIILMAAQVQQKTILVSVLVIQRQNFA